VLNKQHHTNGLLIDNLSYFTCETCDEVAPALGLYPGYVWVIDYLFVLVHSLMADQDLLHKVHDLSDLELATLICLVTEEHGIIDTDQESIDELIQELELV
jgi:hypothetical protein